jgi:signal transduction histidine kinase/putative methionine-R-sulfoxide reductase with GAF domain
MSTPLGPEPAPDRRVSPREMTTLLAEAVLALRATSELSVSWDLARASLRQALGAMDARLLRVDRRSGALYVVEDSGVETPYLAEHGGPVEWVMRNDRARYDESLTEEPSCETLLWREPPASLATLPLVAGSTAFGFLLAGFAAPRDFPPAERLLLQSLSDALALALERAHLRRALEDERAQASRLEHQLASAREFSASLLNLVVTELRSPLSSVKAYSESLDQMAPQSRSARAQFLDVIHEECDRMASLLTDVNDLARIEGGGCTLRLSAISLRELGRASLDRLREIARERGVALELEADETRVEVDHELLRRAVENLVRNGIEFSPRGGTVKLTLAGKESDWTCAVHDQGPALPDSALASAFDRVHQVRRDAPPGSAAAAHGPAATRLGLAIARGIVELHGGRLWVEQAPGVVGGTAPGPSFCFSAPVRQTASPRARRVARQALGRPDLQPLFDAIVEMIGATLESSLVSLVLVDPDRGDLFVAASTGHAGGLHSHRTTLRSGVAGAVAAWGHPLLVDDIETDRRFRRLNHPQYRTKSLLSVPLRVEGEVIGVVNAANKVSGEAFDEDDLGVVVMLTERVGSAIERACAYPDSERVVEDALHTVRAMTRLKREFSLGGRGAVKRSRALARRLGLTPAEVDVIGYVASIHDLGMLRLGPETRHAERLDASQRLAIRAHPEASVEILRPLEYLGQVRELVLAHHERWDGSGYPHGLQGEAIPIGARILAVVDAWESLTTARPWRLAAGREEAEAELRREAGGQFDPEVVAEFLAMLDEELENPRAAA